MVLPPFASTNAQVGHWCSQTCTGSLWHQKECLIPSYLIICAEQVTVPQECGQLVKYAALSRTLHLPSAAVPAGREQSSFCGVIARKFVQIPPSWQLPGEDKIWEHFQEGEIVCFPLPCQMPLHVQKTRRLLQLVLHALLGSESDTGLSMRITLICLHLNFRSPSVSAWTL